MNDRAAHSQHRARYERPRRPYLLLPPLVGDLLARLGPAHLECVHDPSDVPLVVARRQERPLVLGERTQRRRQHLAAEPLHPRLEAFMPRVKVETRQRKNENKLIINAHLVLVVFGVGNLSLANARNQFEVLLAEYDILPRRRIAHSSPEIGIFALPAIVLIITIPPTPFAHANNKITKHVLSKKSKLSDARARGSLLPERVF